MNITEAPGGTGRPSCCARPWGSEGRCLAGALAAALLVLASGGARALRAQGIGPSAHTDLGATVSLPPLLRPFLGGYFGALGSPGASAALGAGVYKDVLDPTLGVLGVQLEGYLGAAAHRGGPQGSVALGLRSPSLRLGTGLDLELPGAGVAPFLSIMHPVRRGGLLIPGGLVHATWVFGGTHRLRIGLALPVGQPMVGEDRPRTDHVELRRRAVVDPPLPAADAVLARAAADVRGWVLGVNQVVVPFVGPMRPMRGDDGGELADIPLLIGPRPGGRACRRLSAGPPRTRVPSSRSRSCRQSVGGVRFPQATVRSPLAAGARTLT